MGRFVVFFTVWIAFAGAARAHDGHGLSGSHWHASDAWGFVALAALVGAAIWLSKNKK